MSRQCNGKGCRIAWDCDCCYQINGCNKHIVCDECGAELYDDFYEVEGDDLCLECLISRYRQTIGY